MGRVFGNGPGDLGSIPGRVLPKTFKMVLATSLLNTQQYKVRIKGKIRNLGRENCPLLHLAIEKGAFWSPSTSVTKFTTYCLDYVLWTLINLIKNGFTFKNDKKQTIFHRKHDRCRLRRWSSAFQKYTCSSKIHTASPKAKTAKIFGLNVNANKTQYICLNKKGAIPTQYAMNLKLVNHTSAGTSH